MHRLTLLERISSLEKHKVNKYDQMTLERSVMRHLSDMLNTRKGTVPIAPDYGIADVTDLGRSFSQESIDQFAEDLECVILRYEPRLKDVKITYDADEQEPLSARFKMEVELTQEFGNQRLAFETKLDSAGNMVFVGEN